MQTCQTDCLFSSNAKCRTSPSVPGRSQWHSNFDQTASFATATFHRMRPKLESALMSARFAQTVSTTDYRMCAPTAAVDSPPGRSAQLPSGGPDCQWRSARLPHNGVFSITTWLTLRHCPHECGTSRPKSGNQVGGYCHLPPRRRVGPFRKASPAPGDNATRSRPHIRGTKKSPHRQVRARDVRRSLTSRHCP